MSEKTTPLLEKYLQTYEQNPTSRVFAPLAQVYRSLGLTDKAIELLKKGVSYHPDYPLAYLVLSQCYEDHGEWELAYSTILPWVSSSKDNFSIQKFFAELTFKIDKFDESLETYKYLLFLSPRDKFFAKRVEELESRSDQAHDNEDSDLKKVEDENFSDWVNVDLSNKSEEAKIVEQIEEYQDQVEFVQQKEEAKSWKQSKLQEAISPISSMPVVTHTLVDLYCKQGHLDKAKEVLEKLVELNPNDQKSILRLEEIHDILGGEESSHQVLTDESSEEGANRLMNIFDKRVKNSEKTIDHVASKFNQFIDELKKRSDEVLR